jgi:sRNA-binding regulator protein Hfq
MPMGNTNGKEILDMMEQTNKRITALSDMLQSKMIEDEKLKAEMQALKDKVDQSSKASEEVVGMFFTLKNGIKMLGWLGSFAKWVTAIAAAVLMIYNWWSNVLPSPK